MMSNFEKKDYIEKTRKNYPFDKIVSEIDRFKNLRICIIGDTIIDRYIFVEPHGRATKDSTLSTRYKSKEEYAGGILAIANHIAGFCNNVGLVSILGDKDRQEDFVRNGLSTLIKPHFFTKPRSPTIVKERIISIIRNEKLLKLDYMEDFPITNPLEDEIINYFKDNLKKYDLIVVGDFGHGFLTDKIVDAALIKYSSHLAANIQTNSANMGFNPITRYKAIDFLTSNEGEIRLALNDKFSDFDSLITKLKKSTNFKNFLLTLGKEGILYSKRGELYNSPALVNSIKDVVGAGDAVFAISALCDYSKMDPELIGFIGNCAGGIAANIIGNKESVTRESLLNFINEIYNG